MLDPVFGSYRSVTYGERRRASTATQFTYVAFGRPDDAGFTKQMAGKGRDITNYLVRITEKQEKISTYLIQIVWLTQSPAFCFLITVLNAY